MRANVSRRYRRLPLPDVRPSNGPAVRTRSERAAATAAYRHRRVAMSAGAGGEAVSDRLAEFLSRARWQDLPSAVRHEAKRSLVNSFACSLGGCRDAAVEAAAGVFKRFAAGTGATVIGRCQRSDALNAAFFNAMSANVFDFDDTHVPTIIHPTAPVAPA